MSDCVVDCVCTCSNSDTLFCHNPLVQPTGSSSYHYRRKIPISAVPVFFPLYLLKECVVRPLTLSCCQPVNQRLVISHVDADQRSDMRRPGRDTLSRLGLWAIVLWAGIFNDYLSRNQCVMSKVITDRFKIILPYFKLTM